MTKPCKKKKSLEKKQEMKLKKVHQNISGPISKLPMDLIIDILSRLPIKTLRRVSMAVKPLLNLITHPRFVLIYHIRATRSTTNSPALVVSQNIGPGKVDVHLYLIDRQSVESLVGVGRDSIQALKRLKSKVTVQESKQSERVMENLSVIRSCNGLLCMSPNDGFAPDPLYICNPVTGDEIFLPSAKIPHMTAYSWTSGFGFDPETNQYKVVRILKTLARGEFVAQVCTVGSDCWRVVPILPYFFEGEDFSVFVSGAVHWIGFKSRDEKIIVSFDMATEKFRKMLLPCGVGLTTPIFHLGAFGLDNLFLATCDSDEKNVEVWVQTKYGVNASWVKKYVISRDIVKICYGEGSTHDTFQGNRNACGYTRVMRNGSILWLPNSGFGYEEGSTHDKFQGTPNGCGYMRVMRNGEILWVHNSGFGYYNPQKGTYRPIGISFKGNRELRRENKFPVAHVESFISPKDLAILNKSPNITEGSIAGV